MKPILEIQEISKRFRISHETQPYLSLRESLSGWMRRSQVISEDFWALRDVSFNVQRGESLGIIGRNGAGKSTLLKILSRITPPTRGRIFVHGRVASLLEVGTGFHPELTGRENVYVNGSMLGMRKQEIDRQFDAILAFAGTEKFLDTPLKHYSSGMQLRLAFAVAAFLEPEILIIDEVLAVGDAEFQKKCIGKMEDVSRSGRTILFVSHNMAAIESLCRSAVLLREGKLAEIGPSKSITRSYLSDPTAKSENGPDQRFITNDKEAQITRLEFLSDGALSSVLFMGNDLEVRAHFRSTLRSESFMLGIVVRDSAGAPFLFFNNRNYGVSFGSKPPGTGIITVQIPQLNLMPGFYSVDVYLASISKDLDVKRGCFSFQVVYKAFEGAGEPLREDFNRVFYKKVLWKMDYNG